MNSVFGRALIGFIILTLGIAALSFTALWANTIYAGDIGWASLIIVVIALVVEVCIFMSTLYDPIHDWIREPKLKAEAEAAAAQQKKWDEERIRERHQSERLQGSNVG